MTNFMAAGLSYDWVVRDGIKSATNFLLLGILCTFAVKASFFTDAFHNSKSQMDFY